MKGERPKRRSAPRQLRDCVDASGKVYVSDWTNGRIRVLTPIGHEPCRRTFARGL
jgi:hypothetical protein